MLTFSDLQKKARLDSSNLTKIRIAIVGDTATQFLTTAIKGAAKNEGYNVDLYEANYNQVEQQLLDASSELHRFNAQYIIVFQSTKKWNNLYNRMTAKQQTSLADERIKFVRTVCETSKSKIIYFNYPEIETGVWGNYANKIEISFTYQVRKMNFELMNLAQEINNLYICDIASLQNMYGHRFMFDVQTYVAADMVLSIKNLPYVASSVVNIIKATDGEIKKCLIIDLDNTIWGGTIGDDGIEGIQLGSLGIGKAFTELQLWIKQLKQRGIIICVCSKNDEDKAKEVFEKHPDMELRLEDIAVFIANWENKAENIKTIHEILNIGYDSMVFIDDSSFERNLVREAIPDITVPELPQAPEDYLECLCSLDLFETASFSTEDVNRTTQYQAKIRREEVARTFDNEDDFLKSLNMVSEVSGLTKFNIPRVAQLSQRSNQFNLRTIRYSETELEAIAGDHSYVSLVFSLKDKFGDYGIVSAVIMRKINDKEMFIDNWFMSCRVLQRGLEDYIFNTIVAKAKEFDIKEIYGEYIPTSKNGIVKEMYPNFGFKIKDRATMPYIIKTCDYKNRKNYIQHNQKK